MTAAKDDAKTPSKVPEKEPTKLKVYVAPYDTVIEGKPTRKGARVVGLSEQRLEAYLAAGLLQETEELVEADADPALPPATDAIDTSADKRTEK